jgi:hypothetical protein
LRPLSAQDIHVSFDNHINQINGAGTDQGEFADIFIFNLRYDLLISIEAKYLKNWGYNKDITGISDRLSGMKKLLVQEGICNPQIIQCLLVTKQKWQNVKKSVQP